REQRQRAVHPLGNAAGATEVRDDGGVACVGVMGERGKAVVEILRGCGDLLVERVERIEVAFFDRRLLPADRLDQTASAVGYRLGQFLCSGVFWTALNFSSSPSMVSSAPAIAASSVRSGSRWTRTSSSMPAICARTKL